MQSWTLCGRTLEFDEENHIYLVNGIIVKSVTQLLGRKFNKRFEGIPKDTLLQAAQRGTQIHKDVEDFCKGKPIDTREVKNFAFMQKHYGFEVVENEIPIIFDLGGETYAGRLDMIIKVGDEYAVADIKTSSALDKEYLGHQLNLYRLGVAQSYPKYNITKLYGIHLREDKRKLVEIPIKGEEWLLKSLELKETE